ncbi:hypothetical protein [Rhizobium sp. BR 315]|uniref:hypothetical protein n=1 Tax=Rhizobium sp. BR 315 TaxID=3040014 RepID=UPI003D32E330
MGDVVKFKSDRIGRQRLMRTAKLEKELRLRFPSAAASGHNDRNPLIAKHHEISAEPQVGVPLLGIAIMILAIAVYALVAFHLTDQPRYSARANLLPPLMAQQ